MFSAMPKKATAAQKGKFVDDEITSRVPRVTRSQGESHSETPSKTSHTLPFPEEIRGVPAPALAPVPPAPHLDQSPPGGGEPTEEGAQPQTRY